VGLNPGLRPGDVVAVTLDGDGLTAEQGDPLQFAVSQPERGAHTLRAVVRDAGGRMVCSASAVTFYVQRPSVLSPDSPARGR